MAERNRERLRQLVKVQLKTQENFLKIKSFLKRVGINPRGTAKLFQTCHILKNNGDFYICHFKELFWLDGRENHMDDLDLQRRDKIISLLVQKGFIDHDLSSLKFSKKAANSVFIVPFSQVENYSFHPKYRFKKNTKDVK